MYNLSPKVNVALAKFALIKIKIINYNKKMQKKG